MPEELFRRLVLREAAGCFWLVDTAQPGRPYRPPLRLNAAGARIWRSLAAGLTPERIAAQISEAEKTPVEEVLRDVRFFMTQIETKLP